VPASDALRGSSIAPVFGRTDAVAEIERLLERTESGKGDVLLLAGEDGSGKSHVLRSVVARARQRGFRVLEGRALPEEIPQPFSLVRDLLRSAETRPRVESPDAPLDSALPMYFAPAGRPIDDGTAAAGERSVSVADTEGLRRLLTPVDTPGEWLGATREELFGNLSQYLLDLAAQERILLAIDDLHFGDSSSIEFLARFVPKIGERPVAVVATVGSGHRVPEGVRGVLDTLEHAETVRTVPLRPLSSAEVAEFATWLRRGIAPDPADVRRWHAQTEGNPLFVEQLVRSSTGVGVRPAGAAEGGTAGLRDILLARVRELPEVEARVLTYASLLGKEFELANLVTISEMGEERVTESLDRLVGLGLLREKSDGVVEFVTEGVRAGVYAELTETRRRLLHRRIGRSLEAKGPVSDFELARQFYLGRDDAKASEYNLRAALTAMRSFAFETAVPYLDRALEAERRRADRDAGRELRVMNELGRALDELGDLHRSEVVLSDAVLLARTQSHLEAELGRALLSLSQTRQDQSEFASAEALAREAFARLERHGTPREVMTANRILGIVAWRLGKLADAEAQLRIVLDIATREGTPIERGHALVDVANVMLQRDDRGFAQALEYYERAAELFGSGQDLGARARVLMNRAVLLFASGRAAEAMAGLDLAIEAAERSRSPIWIGYCYLNRAQMEAELGRPITAKSALERAASLLIPLGDRLAPEQISLARGLVAEAEQRYDAAEAQFEDALRQARALNADPEVAEMLYRLAHVAYSRGNPAVARERLAAARAAGLEALRGDLIPRVTTLEAALKDAP
jgi:tetratricopeptide (TPR) repeat protein